MANTVDTRNEAFEIVKWLFGAITKNEEKSKRAGYDIYDVEDDPKSWVSDLGTRLEINYDNGKTKIIHIRQTDECTVEGLINNVEYGTKAKICCTIFDLPFEHSFNVQHDCISEELGRMRVQSIRINGNGELEIQI